MSKENSEIIYHYTSIETMLSIFLGKKLWVSSTTEMNDRNEGIDYTSSFENALSKEHLNFSDENIDLLFEASDKDLKKEGFLEALNEELRVFFKKTNSGIHSKTHAHICCFSKEPDKLSQWRGYGNDGKGVSIGFNREKLYNSIRKNHPNLKILLGDVIYSDQKSEEQYQSIIDDFKNLFLQFLKLGEPAKQEDLAVIMAKLEIHPFLKKHESFEEESEVRLLHVPSEKTTENTKFRVVNGNIISYFEISFSPECIEEIILGPKCNLNISTPDFRYLINKDFKHLIKEEKGEEDSFSQSQYSTKIRPSISPYK